MFIRKKLIKNVPFGKIPIIVNSKYCVSKIKGVIDECKYDPGGYSIQWK